MKKILINQDPWQTRVAVLREDRLQDVYFDTLTKQDLERCFIKGRVSKILPGIQTAFVDIGQARAGFLHITEIDRALAAERIAELTGEEKDTHHIKHKMDIGKVFREGEEILVQVIKEPVFEKGAKLTTCFTLPGRYAVLMPNIPQVGISKKIEDKAERARLREIMQNNLPKEMGAIVRTTAEGKDAKVIKRDIAFQISIWNAIKKKFKKAVSGEIIHRDLSLSMRVIRDHLDEDVEVIITDDKENQNTLYKFVKNINPEFTHKIRHYQAPPSLFEKFDIEKQLDKALQKKVALKSGGTLIIESTEAMTVIDVNTGKFTGTDNLEETILKTNLEAADEIVTQLRLRNIGGLIVIDFIDMAQSSSRQKVSRFFEKTLKERDKFQSVALKISEFGLVQMTRKRSGKTLQQQLTNECSKCNAVGYAKSPSTISFEVLRKFKSAVVTKNLRGTVVLSVAPQVFDYLVRTEYLALIQVEKNLGCKIILECNEKLEGGHFECEPFKE